MNTKRLTTLLAALALAAWGLGTAYAQPVPGGTLDPTTIPKYTTPLVNPPAMPKATSPVVPEFAGFTGDYYEIAVREFTQQILPPGLPPTKVWSYGPANESGADNTGLHVSQGGNYFYPALTIEATANKPVRVKWVNELKDGAGNFRQHLLPVDPTLHWANPPGGMMGRDTRPAFNTTPGRYTGPVPMIAHLHGAHTYDWSDGYPEAWYLPAATNIPPGYATTGSFYDFYAGTDSKGFTANTLRNLWGPGVAVFEYPNSQRASTLWYHDHTLGMTRLNVYAGPAGFYLIRGGAADVVIDKKTNTPAQLPIDTREVPLAIQDRSFNADGGLFFPDNRAFFEMLNVPGVTPQQFPGLPELNVPFIGAGACLGASDISPIWNPEFFGNTMVVNGQTWPYMEVQPQRYRFRLLNGCNSRFLILRAVTATDINNPLTWTQVPNAFTQIGSEGGFLPKPVIQNELLIGLAERADTIMDFSAFPPGSTVYLVNVGPDTPFGGGAPGVAFPPADPTTTGQVMQFRVVPLAAPDTTTPPKQYVLPAITPIKANKGAPIRQLSLNELDSATLLVNFDVAGNLVAACNDPLAFPFGPKEAQLGTMMFDPVAGGLMPMAMPWMDPVTEKPGLGVTEVWEIYNFTMDAHPIHLHQTMFQVIDRQNLKVDKAGMTLMPAKLSGAPVPAMPWESGFKDTVIAYPGQVTRLKATFDLPGLYVWHCHIIDHEDNEMMRPLFVGPNIAAYPDKLSMAPMPMP